jgi:GNAT superfamily N-acetyltransferase
VLSAPLTALHALPLEGGTLSIRHAEIGDMPFVLDSWLRSYASTPWGLSLGPRYRTVQEHRARWCIERGTCLAAFDEEAPEIVLGWACGRRDPSTLDYVYVMREARGRNIGRLLAMQVLGGQPSGTVRMTHRVRREFRKNLPANWIWLPLTREETGDAHAPQAR